MQETFKIVWAIQLLKQGEIIRTISNQPVYFSYEQEKILAHSELTHFHINLDDFLSIFSLETFILHQTHKEAEINIEKDIEYYQWKK